MRKIILGVTIHNIDRGLEWLSNLLLLPYKLVVFFNNSDCTNDFYNMAIQKGLNIIPVFYHVAYQNALNSLYGELVTDDDFSSDSTDFYTAKNILQKHVYDEWEENCIACIADSEDIILDIDLFEKILDISGDIVLVRAAVNNKLFRGNIVAFNKREALLIPNIKINVNFSVNLEYTHDFIWPIIAINKKYIVRVIDFEKPLDYNNIFCAAYDLLSYIFSRIMQTHDINISREKIVDLFGEIRKKEESLLMFSLTEGQKKSVQNIIKCMQDEDLIFAFTRVREPINRFHTDIEISEIAKLIEETFFSSSLRLLGMGSESIVYTDNINVYKYFISNSVNLSFLMEISSCFATNEHFYSIRIEKCCGHSILIYKYEESKPYTGGMADQLVDFLLFQKNNGFVFKNIKRENFIVVNGVLKLIDYGYSFDIYTDDLFKIACLRAYQMLKYVNLSEYELRKLTIHTMKFGYTLLQFGYSNFRFLLDNKLNIGKSTTTIQNDFTSCLDDLDEFLHSSYLKGLDTLSLVIRDYWFDEDKYNIDKLFRMLSDNNYRIISVLPNVVIDNETALPKSSQMTINIAKCEKSFTQNIHNRSSVVLFFTENVSAQYALRFVDIMQKMQKYKIAVMYPGSDDYMSLLLKYHPFMSQISFLNNDYCLKDFKNNFLLFLKDGDYPIDQEAFEQAIFTLQKANTDIILFKEINLRQPLCVKKDRQKYIFACRCHFFEQKMNSNCHFFEYEAVSQRVDTEFFYFDK